MMGKAQPLNNRSLSVLLCSERRCPIINCTIMLEGSTAQSDHSDIFMQTVQELVMLPDEF